MALKYPFYRHIKHLAFCVQDAILSAGDSVMEGAGEGNLLLWSFHSQILSTSFHHSHQLTVIWVEAVGSHKGQNLTLSFLVRGNWFTQQKRERQKSAVPSATLCTVRPGAATSPEINNRLVTQSRRPLEDKERI